MSEPRLQEIEAAIASAPPCFACDVQHGHTEDCPIRIMGDLMARSPGPKPDGFDEVIAELTKLTKEHGVAVLIPSFNPVSMSAHYFRDLYTLTDGMGKPDILVLPMEMSERDVELRIEKMRGRPVEPMEIKMDHTFMIMKQSYREAALATDLLALRMKEVRDEKQQDRSSYLRFNQAPRSAKKSRGGKGRRR
jgi:hypothetical protein